MSDTGGDGTIHTALTNTTAAPTRLATTTARVTSTRVNRASAGSQFEATPPTHDEAERRRSRRRRGAWITLTRCPGGRVAPRPPASRGAPARRGRGAPAAR